ncbi:MAG: ABC transporter substrate-binding protein [Parachlamydia sp.]|nr:ABC transporter substrate-binding protein [Parachlamydia sp.]
MKNTTKVIMGFTMVFAVIVGLYSFTWAADSKVIKIGYTAPFTGAAAEFGTNGWRGIQLALDDVNKTGIKIKGQTYKIDIIRYDSVCTPVDGVANMRKLAMEDKVVAVLGDHCSSVCTAIAPLCDEYKTPGLTIECAADKVTKPGNEFYFRMRPSMSLIAPLAAPKIAKKFQPKKIGFLLVNDDYGHSFANSLKEEFTKLGVATAVEEAFERGNTDFMVYLTKIKDSKADMVLYVGTTPEGAMILKQAKELGITKNTAFIGSEEMGEMELLSLAGASVVEGTYGIALWGGVPAEFEKRVKDKFNAPMHYAIIFGYDALRLVAKAIESAQSLDSVKIKDAMKKTDYQGYQGHIKFENFDGFKNQGRYVPTIVQWSKGKRQVVEVK